MFQGVTDVIESAPQDIAMTALQMYGAYGVASLAGTLATSMRGAVGATSAVHLTNAAGRSGILNSGILNGPYSAWTFATGRVPLSWFGKLSKSMVRPSRLTSAVEGINTAGLIVPKLRGPLSLFQRMNGVLRTPGPGAYNIRTGQFFPGKLFDKSTGLMRDMNRKELFYGGVAHDILLEAIGYGAVSLPFAATWTYKVFRENGFFDE
jgi:hypothetical protein